MSESPINYRDTYFQHPSLTKISGDPTYESLAKLERECKANGKSVRSTLGGGSQGLLGLVSSARAYERSSPGVPFVRPDLPEPINFGAGTAAQLAEARQQYDDNLATFNACQLVERTIVQQINTAVDDDCLADMIDDETGLLTGTVPEIFQHLFDTYGAITPQSLSAAKAKLESTTYDHARPITNIFTAINNYANMAEAAHASETPHQLINIGLIIITRSTIFASDIRKWNDKPEPEKTWPLFKDHFKEAQKAIKKSQPVTTPDSLGCHEHANAAAIVDQVIARLTTQHDDEAAEQIAEQQMGQHLANSTQQNQNMLEQMQSLTATLANLQTQVNSHGRGGGGRGRGPAGREGRGGRGGRGNGRPTPKYCWSHGNCAHDGTECRTKSEGHIDDATWTNMQGDSTRNCPWIAHTNNHANHAAIVDTGATGHYLDAADEKHCIEVQRTDTGPSVQVANGETIETTKRAVVPLATELSTPAKVGHIFDSLKSGSLISIGQLCDDDCVALFTRYDVKIIKNGQVIIIGKRNATNGLWNIPLAPKEKPPTPTSSPRNVRHSANGAIQNVGTKQDLAAYFHACNFSPLPSTFLRAIKRGHYSSWPGLTDSLVTKHLPKSRATSKGHLRMQQKNIQSTKITTDLPIETSLDVSPSQEPNNTRTHAVFATVAPATELQKSYSDQTGKFPVQSSRGYNYVMVVYDYDSNAILSTPLKTRQAGELTSAWTKLHSRLQLNGYAPTLHILDNECSDELKQAFKKYDVDFQRVPSTLR